MNDDPEKEEEDGECVGVASESFQIAKGILTF